MNPDPRRRRSRACAALALFLCMVGAGGALAAQAPPRVPSGAPGRELWLFFSPDPGPLAADLERLTPTLRNAPGVVLRPVLLAQDLGGLRKPGKDLAAAVKALQALQGEAFGLPVLDEEGLARAKALSVDRLPAYALIEPPNNRGVRRATLATGYGVTFEELLR